MHLRNGCVPKSLTVHRSIQFGALTSVEAKKKFEFLEAVTATMDAHLRYFKQVLK